MCDVDKHVHFFLTGTRPKYIVFSKMEGHRVEYLKISQHKISMLNNLDFFIRSANNIIIKNTKGKKNKLGQLYVICQGVISTN